MRQFIQKFVMPVTIGFMVLFLFQFKAYTDELNVIIDIQKTVISSQDTLIDSYRDNSIKMTEDLKLKDLEIEKIKENAALMLALDPLRDLMDESDISDLMKEIPHGKIFFEQMGITAGFGESVDNHGKYRSKHKANDVIPLGEDFRVSPFAAGTVTQIGQDNIFGKFIYIQHSERVRSFYAHAEKIFYTALPGSEVTIDDVIMIMGDTGLSDGPHVHFQIEVFTGERWVPIDPKPFFDR
ncbi:MAG: M23 family metallopeptidase [Spirochaetaceae bacterium]|nr:M23 family metallopeptidase [Spirochaetaceae bacterium]